MSVYIINLFITTVMAIFVKRRKINKWFAILLVVLPMVIVAGCRWRVGTDCANYYFQFERIPNYSFNLFFSDNYEIYIPWERGFSVLIWIIGLINKNPQFIMFIFSFINIAVIVYNLKKYSSNFSLSIYLYITTMIYYSAFNGVRQWLASVIIFWGFRYLLKKDFKKYLIVVLIASCIHISAWITLPMYFIVNSKPFGKKILVVMLIIIIISFGLAQVLNSFSDVVTTQRYESYTSISEDDNGVNIFRVIVAAIPVIWAFVYRKQFENDKENRILINYSMINFLLLFLAMQKTVLARFCMYFELYNLLLYPKLISTIKKDSRLFAISIIAICFFIYMYLLLPVDSNLLPYRVFWTK